MKKEQLRKYWQAYTDAWWLIKTRDKIQPKHIASMVSKHSFGAINRLFCLVVWQEIKRIRNAGAPLSDSEYKVAFTTAWELFKNYNEPIDTDEFWMELVSKINVQRKEYENSQFICNLLINVTLEEIERIGGSYEQEGN